MGWAESNPLRVQSYRDHAKELGNAVPTEPFFFLKPVSSYLKNGGVIVIPPKCTDLHHEVEQCRRE